LSQKQLKQGHVCRCTDLLLWLHNLCITTDSSISVAIVREFDHIGGLNPSYFKNLFNPHADYVAITLGFIRCWQINTSK